MKTRDEHRAKLREIADYAFDHGRTAMEQAGIPMEFAAWSRETKLDFLIKCQDGFKLAQKLLIEEILYYQELQREVETQLKSYKTQRLKKEVKEATGQKALIEHRLLTLSHIADSIAWQLLRGQLHLARRLVLPSATTKFLVNSNIEHAIAAADKINENPLDFALISDITGYVGIGDLLIKHLTSVGIMELKEGNINDQLTEFFAELERENKPLEEVDLSSRFDSKTVKQVERMQRQKTRMSQAVQVMNTDIGIDPGTQKPIVVSTPTTLTERYFDELIQLQKQLKTQSWAYLLVEDCLYIGAYRDEAIAKGPFLIELLVKEKTKEYILIDWTSIIEQVSQPLFAKPLEPDFIIDIMTGKVKVIMALDINGLIQRFNDVGLQTRWMTTKETAKVKANDAYTPKSLVVFHNQGILMTEPDSEKSVMGWGVISRILYDNIKPTNVALSFLTAQKPSGASLK
ncbi:hypothetical protein GCM10023172_42320 [Hymenobacter ginsengisoli]|uniref:Uncharacterized protein n=1 Tax=Hymenobacter ginsengisoli TaxID=1051626 RepID=A0ABP8QT45_9BACT|nr:MULTISPECIES: hypothetical protein [unclassified Hymenobacter]MBO2033393.1 hypothetical protein [Hymenobacter sp. BT559]